MYNTIKSHVLQQKIVSKNSFFFSSRRRHTILTCDWSSDVCSSDLDLVVRHACRAQHADHARQGAQAIRGRHEREGRETRVAVLAADRDGEAVTQPLRERLAQ